MPGTTAPSACAVCRASVSPEAAGPLRCPSCGAAQRAGAYAVVRLLAQGPHSRVYVAQDAAGHRVALKELLFALVPGASEIEAFYREAELLRSLRNPGIPRFIEAFQEGEGPALRLYLAQEFVEGETLLQRVAGGPLREEEARAVAAAVLEILRYLHSRSPRVLHRDVKPANLIRRLTGQIVLVDFGSARPLERGMTHGATLVGTIGYMPPEQMAGTVSVESDLYALGATLLHLMTGRPPAECLASDGSLAVPRLDASARFRAFVAKLLQPRAERRFRSAAEAAQALAKRSSSFQPIVPIACAVAGVAAGGLLFNLLAADRGPKASPAAQVKTVPGRVPEPGAPAVVSSGADCVQGYAFGNPDPDPNAAEAARWQTFVAPASGRLSELTVKVRKVRGAGQGDVKLVLSSPEANGCPGQAVATATIPRSDVAETFTEVTGLFADAVVSAGQRYNLMMTQTPGVGPSCYEWCVGAGVGREAYGKMDSGGRCVSERGAGWFQAVVTP